MLGLHSIPPGRKILRGLVIGIAGALVVLGLAIVLLWEFLGIHSMADITAYRTMMQGRYHPVWKDLAWRRIRTGDQLEEVLQGHPSLHREDFGPYTELLGGTRNSPRGLGIWAKNGRLIAAKAWGRGWHHTFFATPAEERPMDEAHSAYVKQRTLEWNAFRIHRAITAGQDVFLARVIEHREVPDDSLYSPRILEEMREIYGREYLEQMGLAIKPKLTVEVTTALHGDLQSGAVLTFTVQEYEHAEPGQPEPVFLHFEDARQIDPHSQNREIYLMVPRQALDWYRSLTADQVKDFEARCLAESAKRGITR